MYLYCKALGHVIKKCSKVATKEAKKKVVGMVQMLCNIQNGRSLYNAVMTHHCMMHVCGATKHIFLHHHLFTSLGSTPKGIIVTCANNFSYLVKEDG